MKDTALLSSIAHSSQATRIKKFKPHPLFFAIAMAGLGLPTGVMAGPQGGVVTGGAGTISQGNNTTTINQATDRLAIDWQSFDVAADERVQYIQPDSSSVALNRILSNRGSEIHGRIDANGDGTQELVIASRADNRIAIVPLIERSVLHFEGVTSVFTETVTDDDGNSVT